MGIETLHIESLGKGKIISKLHVALQEALKRCVDVVESQRRSAVKSRSIYEGIQWSDKEIARLKMRRPNRTFVSYLKPLNTLH